MKLTKDTPICELLHSEDELTHWGVKGMKWGVRRYQNEDGTLTSEGKKRYDDGFRGYAFDDNRYVVPAGRPHKDALPDLGPELNQLLNGWTDTGRDYVNTMPSILDINFDDLPKFDPDSIPKTMPAFDAFEWKNRNGDKR